MMLDCDKATQLISESQERSLTLRERFALKLHLFVCQLCKQFKSTVRLLGNQAGQYGAEEASAEDSACLSDSAKQRIRKALEDSQGDV